MVFRSLLIGSLVVAAAQAVAWIDTGHMVVAAVAETRLRPEVKLAVTELLGHGGDEKTRDFLGATCWADDNKNEKNGPWHYINFHFRRDGKPTENMPLEENVVWAINKFSDAMINPELSREERADALRYVLHFVGDVHQPLHCVACDSDELPKGDRGGNDFLFDSFLVGSFQVRNLHFLWDIGGGLYGNVTRPLTDRGAIDAIRDRLIAQHPIETMSEITIEDPEQWAREGAMLAQTLVYATAPKTAPNASYLGMTQFVSGRRLVMAGHRLANLLNTAFAAGNGTTSGR